jgi:hypothetical protein
MKPTKDSFFVDSNILIYAHTDLDATKQQIAQKIIIDFHTSAPKYYKKLQTFFTKNSNILGLIL